MISLDDLPLPGWLRRLVAASEARVLAGLALAAGGVWALLVLGGEVREGETDAFDRRILVALRVAGDAHRAIGPRWLQEVLRDVTALGGATAVLLVTVLAAVALVFHGHKGRGLVLAATVLLAQACDELLKNAYNRARPDFELPGTFVYAQSFPAAIPPPRPPCG